MGNTNRQFRGDPQWLRAPRLNLDLEVKSKTIGTNTNYSLFTEDVSRSGILLVWERDSRVPFIVNTLIEMTIDPSCTCLGQPVTCLGKVVRREATGAANGHGTRLGIQIVQIDSSDQHTWEGCLNEIEKRMSLSVPDEFVA
jgi:hypothetical protein